MSETQEQGILRWMRSQIFRNRQKPLARFVLRNASTGFKSGEVEEFELPDEQLTPEQVSELAENIMLAARRDADATGTKLQTYLLMAIEAGAKDGPRHRFRVRGEGEEDDSGEEKPDQQGVTQMLMRHQEALMRMSMMGTQQIIANLSKQLEQANNTIVRLNEEKNRMLVAVEEAANKQHERELQLLTAGNEEERKTLAYNQAITKLNELWPVIVNRISGRRMLSEGETSLLKQFLNGLRHEQLVAIAGHLSNEQRISLMTMYNELKKDKE